jgi:hypothetical protein
MDFLRKQIERKTFCDIHKNLQKNQRFFSVLCMLIFSLLSLSLAFFLLCLSFSTNVSFFCACVYLVHIKKKTLNKIFQIIMFSISIQTYVRRSREIYIFISVFSIKNMSQWIFSVDLFNFLFIDKTEWFPFLLIFLLVYTFLLT